MPDVPPSDRSRLSSPLQQPVTPARSQPLPPQSSIRCPGTFGRRGFLQCGLTGLASLGLADLLRLQTLASSTTPRANQKSLIVLWLWGGPSHMETFDMKPEAPLEYRGEFRPISTRVPGLEISEHLPLLADQAERLAIIRSLHHDSPGHVNSTHTMLTGYPGSLMEAPPYQPDYPDFWSVVSKVQAARAPGIPAHITMPRLRYHGSAYLGGGLDPFVVGGDPNQDNFQVPNLALQNLTRPRFEQRLDLLSQIDKYRRDVDLSGVMDSLDEFQGRAVSLLTQPAVREAFDLSRESDEVRDRYGRNEVGQRTLLARRLVEAGVRIVTIDFPYVPGQKAKSWDDHASVWNIFEEMRARLPVLDQVASALIDDIHQRGMDEDVMVLVMGEMSHTPRLSNYKGQPGREHWGQSMSVLMSGGGMRCGQVIGQTNRTGEEPSLRPLTPNDLLASLYRYFDVPLDLHFENRAGRPTPILPHGTPIDELF
jgi:hypothetical protein